MLNQGIRSTIVIGDSSIVIQWGVKARSEHLKNQNYIQFHIMKLIRCFDKLDFLHVLRLHKKVADKLAKVGVTLAPETL